MHSFSARLKAAREQLALSQKEFAELIGASFRACQDYEGGKSLPGGRVLTAIAKTGISLDWLLTGEGETWRNSEQANSSSSCTATLARQPDAAKLNKGCGTEEKKLDFATSDLVQLNALISDLRQAEEAGLSREFGIESIDLVARRGSQENLWWIMKLLAGARGEPISAEELAVKLRALRRPVTTEDILADIAILAKHGLITAGGSAYSLSDKVADIYARDVANVNQHIREAIRHLTNEVLPAIERRDGSGYLLLNVSNVPIGTAAPLSRSILNTVKGMCNKAGEEDGPEEVTVVLSVVHSVAKA